MMKRMPRGLRRLLLGLGLGTLCGLAQAAELQVGDAAPDCTLPGSDGKAHHLADYRGTAVVVAWFPKAFTGG